MKLRGFVLLAPGGDRPYFSSFAPSPEACRGGKLYSFELDTPEPEVDVDAHLAATAVQQVQQPPRE